MTKAAAPELTAEIMISLSDVHRDTIAQIAEDCGAAPGLVSEISTRLARKFQPLSDALTQIEDASMADLYLAQSRRVALAVTDADIEKAGLKEKAIASAVFFDKHLLAKGQPTVILSVPQLENLDKLFGLLQDERKHRGFSESINEDTDVVTLNTGGPVGHHKADPTMSWSDPEDQPR